MIVERPKSFIPVEDQGTSSSTVQTPDGTTQEPTAGRWRVEQIARSLTASATSLLRRPEPAHAGQPVQHRHLRGPQALGGRKGPELRRRRPPAHSSRSPSEISEAIAGLPAPADPGAGHDRRLRVHDRGPRGQGRRGTGRRSRTGSSPRPASGPSSPASSPLSRPASPSSGSNSTAARPEPGSRRLQRLRASSRSISAAIMSTTSTASARPGRSYVQAEGRRPARPRTSSAQGAEPRGDGCR